MKSGVLIFFMISLLLSGCSADAKNSAPDLLQTEPGSALEAPYKLVAPENRDIVRDYTPPARLVFPSNESLFCEDETRLVAVYTANYMEVKKGDLLAELEYDSDAVQTEIALIEVDINREEQQQAIRQREHEFTLRETDRKAAVEVSPHQRRVYSAMRERELIAFDQTVWEHENAISDLEEKLEEQRGKTNVISLAAPFDGYAIGVTSKKPGDVVDPGESVIRVFDDSVYQARITAQRGTIHYGMPVTIQVPRGEMYSGTIVSDPAELSKSDPELTFRVNIGGVIPDPYSVNSLDLPSIIRGQYRENAFCVPFSCLGTEDDRRFVTVLEDGVIKKRYVKTGLTNRDYAEILYGLSPSAQIFASPT